MAPSACMAVIAVFLQELLIIIIIIIIFSLTTAYLEMYKYIYHLMLSSLGPDDHVCDM